MISEEIALPVPRHRASGYVGGTRGNWCAIGQLAASVLPTHPRSTGLTRRGSTDRPARWLRQTAACSCRQDPGGADVPQSARASSPPSVAPGHAVITMGHGVFQGAVGVELGYRRGAPPFRPGRDRRVSCSDRPRGSPCSRPVPRSAPWFGANALGRALD